MEKITYISFIFFLFMSYTVQAGPEIQKAGTAADKVFAEAVKGGYKLISPEEMKKEYLEGSERFHLVDVRQEWSYQMQHIKGALHIDFAPMWWNQYSPMMRSDLKKVLGPDKDNKFVFY